MPKGVYKRKIGIKYPNRKKMSQEQKDKISESHKGKLGYWLGKHRSEVTKRKISVSNSGSKMTEERKIKIGNANKGLKRNNETKEKIRQANLGKKLSEATKKKISIWNINHPNTQFKDTSIEIKVEKELLKREVEYRKQVALCNIAIVDFYLPKHNIVIECDGDYWHNKPETKKRDILKTNILIKNGYKVFRFWQHEIDTILDDCFLRLNLDA